MPGFFIGAVPRGSQNGVILSRKALRYDKLSG